MKKFTRALTAAAAVAALSLGVAACSQAEDAANKTGEAAKSAGAEASAKVDSATDKKAEKDADKAAAESEAMASDAESTEAMEGDNAEAGDLVKITTPKGEVAVPADFATQIKNKIAEWGEVAGVDTVDGGAVATFAQDKVLAYSKEFGVQPIVGKIAETWIAEGGVNSSLGMPKGSEMEQGTGWIQEFANGTIEWIQGATGKYEAKITQQ